MLADSTMHGSIVALRDNGFIVANATGNASRIRSRCADAVVDTRYFYLVRVARNVIVVLLFFLRILIEASLPPLHNLRTHIDKAGLRFAFREEGYRFDGFVDVFLGECPRLFETRTLGNDFSCLCVVSNRTGGQQI
jgi:hypothetical protein